MLNLALFGPPGAGKGTQSAALVDYYNLFYISTGDLLRKELKEQTRLGKEAQEIIASGGLVSDEIIVQIIENTITGHPDAGGFLFDGFPRTHVQAYILEGLMINLNTSLHCLLSLEVPEEESVRRLLERGKSSGRSDDNEAVIRNRLREYREKTLPVLNFYRERGICHDIDGTQSIEEVEQSIHDVVSHELSKRLLNIVVFGYPGSGRGTQSELLAEKYGLELVATGRMLDEEIKKGTDLGKKIQQLYENGELVPDEIVVRLIEQKIEETRDTAKGYIFKGYPRTLVQSYILDGLLKKHGSSLNMILEIEVPTLELVSRLDARSKTQRAMPYDSALPKIVKRLSEHEQKTLPVIDRYRKLRDVQVIDGRGTLEEVSERVSAVVEEGFRRMR
ncbi:MAG: adenylate kinase [Opitutales bacterium]